MRALVSGDKGMVGRHMVEELKSRGWDVYGYDLKDGDDAVDYFRESTDEDFDLLVHAAYVVGGREHIDGKNHALAKNVQLDGSMFEWGLRSRVGAIIYFSSSAAYPVEYQSKVYGPHKLKEDDLYLEDPGTPDSNYGWAKLTGERMAKAYSECGGRVHVLRPFSGYATDQDLTYPFPAIIQRAQRGDFSVWGPPGQTRDWIHIDDVINGSLEVYHQDIRVPVNLCTGRPTEFGELITTAARMGGPESRGREPKCVGVHHLKDKPTGVFYRVGDPTLLLNHYEPKVSLEEGIAKAVTKR